VPAAAVELTAWVRVTAAGEDTVPGAFRLISYVCDIPCLIQRVRLTVCSLSCALTAIPRPLPLPSELAGYRGVAGQPDHAIRMHQAPRQRSTGLRRHGIIVVVTDDWPVQRLRPHPWGASDWPGLGADPPLGASLGRELRWSGALAVRAFLRARRTIRILVVDDHRWSWQALPL